MYIAPGTRIYLFSGVPLDNTYNNTINFTSASQQSNYFLTDNYQLYNGKYFQNQTYQRLEKGKMRLKVSADEITNYNYLMFQNTQYSTKWWYAFILGVEYINNEVAELRIEIDVLQTWLFEAELESCYVERIHSNTDAPGDNLQAEGLDTGEYVQSGQFKMNATDGLVIVAAATFDKNGVEQGGGYRAGIFNGLTLNVFADNPNGYSELSQWLSANAAKASEIVSIFYAPAAYANATGSGHIIPFDLTAIPKPTSIGAYTPRNKKLLTYPYNFAYISNLQGTNAVYRYEFFKSTNVVFQAYGDFSLNPSMLIAPVAYKAESGSTATNWDEALQLTGFPQISYNTDSFKAWLAQAASSIYGGLALGAIGGFLTGDLVTGATGGIVNAVRTIAEIPKHLIAPQQAHATSSPTTYVATNMFDFMYYNKHITEEFASVIDQYFDWYGYASNRVFVPSRNVRRHWTFIKTKGCDVRGSLPSDAKTKIDSIYDKGIRWWNKDSRVGMYTIAVAEENMVQ